MVKTISIFGSTGSIGLSTLEVIRSNPDKFKVEVLVAYNNVKELVRQAKEFNPKYVCIVNRDKYQELKDNLSHTSIELVTSLESMKKLCAIKVDIVMMAIVGAAAIEPTIKAIQAGNNIALANKECLVCAGKLIKDLAQKHNIKIIPVDSEHSGLFQIFDYKNCKAIKNITLTASGGPFRNYSVSELEYVTKQQALKHPNWSMGAKITIDSATMVNKCLEVIEAYFLFPLQPSQIKILIHPESIIHAILSFTDGSSLAQFSLPNMQIPISYALSYPNRITIDQYNNFDLAICEKMTFFHPDKSLFKSLQTLDKLLAEIDTNAPLVFNIANEIAVEAFLKDKIKFIQIIEVIEAILDKSSRKVINEYEETIAEIESAKILSQNYINNILR